MHVICHRFASLMWLIPLSKSSQHWVIFLEGIVSSLGVITKNTGDGKVLGTSVEDHVGWLRDWRAHVKGTDVDGVVFADERNLHLEIFHVCCFLCLFAYQLCGMGMIEVKV